MKRYCPMCDIWMSAAVCRACGMPTDRATIVRSAQQTYNDNTRKLIPTGDAHRDRLVAASINLRRTE